MKVSVLGAGAVGSMFGALLQRNAPDIDVTLVVHGEYGRAVHERQSVTVDGPWGSRCVPVRTSFDPADISGSDVVLLTVKSQATEEAARAAAPYLGNATLVSIQNGINDRVLTEFVSPLRLVMAVTATNMAIIEPARVSLQLGGDTVLGPPTGHPFNDRVRSATDTLKRINTSALSFHARPTITGMQYNKLAVNALGYASCLSASNIITEALCNRQWRESVGLPIIDECRKIFARASIQPETISGVPFLRRIGRLTRMMGWPLLGPAIRLGARRKFNRKPIVFSLLQDLKRGKSTEVEYVNGEIVRLAEAVGLAAPMNATVIRLVHNLEARGPDEYFTRDEVISRFQDAACSSHIAHRTDARSQNQPLSGPHASRSTSNPKLDTASPS